MLTSWQLANLHYRESEVFWCPKPVPASALGLAFTAVYSSPDSMLYDDTHFSASCNSCAWLDQISLAGSLSPWLSYALRFGAFT